MTEYSRMGEREQVSKTNASYVRHRSAAEERDETAMATNMVACSEVDATARERCGEEEEKGEEVKMRT